MQSVIHNHMDNLQEYAKLNAIFTEINTSILIKVDKKMSVFN